MFTESALGQRFVELLRGFDNVINTTLREIITDFSLKTLLMLVGFSIIYGVLHSLGPGHGKALVASYFLKEKHPLSRSLALGAIVSFVHTLSAIILSLLLFYLLTGIRGMFRIQLQSYFIVGSGVLIFLLGILFLFLKFFKRKTENSQNNWGKKSFLLVGISAGIIPCPVSSMIMLLTLSRGVVYIGLISVFSISLGMFVVLAATGLLSIFTRSGILNATTRVFKKTETVSTVIEYLSIAFIIFLGLSMASTFLLF